MDVYDVLLFGLFAGTLGCFWRAWRNGEIRDIALVLRRCAEQGVTWER
jgi:hypothetical protein